MMPFARMFFAAIGFLTRIPVPFMAKDADEATDDIRRGVVLFPLVGVGIGAITTGVLLGGHLIWPWWFAVVVALSVEAMLTGAFHEDAVADFCDAFGGGWTRDDVLRILKDSRIGSFGAVGLIAALSIRVGAIIQVSPELVWFIVPLSAGFGRWVILWLLTCIEPIGHRVGLAKDVAERATWWKPIIGGLTLAPLFWLYGQDHFERIAIAFTVTAIFIIWFRWYLNWRIGGVTGDCLGTACYVGQLIWLLVAVARIKHG